MSRLDFFLVSEDMYTLNINCDINPGYRTDHSMVTLELNLNNSNTRGKGFFKLNTSILQDIEYINIIKACIQENTERYAKPNQNLENKMDIKFEITDRLFLDTLKMEIRRESIRYSAKKKRNQVKTEINLINEIRELEIRIDQVDNVSEQIMNEIHTKKASLELLRNNKMKGILLRSQIDWHEYGEKPTQYFCGLEKTKYVNKTVYKIEKDGNQITNQTMILPEMTHYLSEGLYLKRALVFDFIQPDLHTTFDIFISLLMV